MKTLSVLTFILVTASVLFGCGSREVTRTDPGLVTDLSGYWNETDSRMVADSMVAQCLGGRWLAEYSAAPGRGTGAPRPVIVVGGIFNESSEHINTNLFMNEIERSILESGEVSIAAGGSSRAEVRAERHSQGIFASPETAAAFGREVGADFVMTGNIGSIVDEQGSTRSIYYQVNLELIDVETALKSWMGSLQIKKMIEW